MPVILHKTKTVGLVSSAAPEFASLANMSNGIFGDGAEDERR